jgi:uncharacterized 2Fe-2S/4Fe-4S cluster protein (DUF4445 family)
MGSHRWKPGSIRYSLFSEESISDLTCLKDDDRSERIRVIETGFRMTKKPRVSSKTRLDHTVTFLPFNVQVEVPSNTNLLDALRKTTLPLHSSCGGKGTCGDCVVQIIKGTCSSKASASLPQKILKQGYVLACQATIEDNLSVKLPEFEELSIKSSIDSHFLEKNREILSGVLDIEPSIKRIVLTLPSSTLEDNYSDLRILESEIKKRLDISALTCEYTVLKNLAHTIRENEKKVSITLLNQEGVWNLIEVRPYSSKHRIYGVACDIGTTTVALHLVDFEDGKIVSSASSINQQIKCGEDIISRISYAQKTERLQELHDLIILTINNLLDKVYQSARITPPNVYYLSVTGNTTMVHLFLKLDPRYIREAPYVPTVNRVPIILSRDLGLKMNTEGRVHCAPSVGSYVGGDILAGLLCSPIVKQSQKVSMFIDIGTNGELVLGNKEWLMSCACSAGPAFEGGGIRCGMPAMSGAIEAVKLDEKGRIDYTVIDGGKPKGLCGSGLIDLLAELFIYGYVDRNGKFNKKKAADKLIDTDSGEGFVIEKYSKSFWGRDLVITENDIANLIRTKGAVFSACSLLLKNAGLSFDQVDSFYIAGGFGQNLVIENAIRIGLLPDLERDKFRYLGNTSLIGAYLVLLSERNKDLVNELERMMTYIELNTEPGYFNEYTGALFLPHTARELFPSVERLLNFE